MSVDVFLLFWMRFRHKVDNTKKEKLCESRYLVLKMSDFGILSLKAWDCAQRNSTCISTFCFHGTFTENGT